MGGHEPQETECRVVCPKVSIGDILKVRAQKGQTTGMEEYEVRGPEGIKQEQKKVLFYTRSARFESSLPLAGMRTS